LGKRRIQQKLIVRFSGWQGLQNTDPMPAQIVDRMQPALSRRKHHGCVPAHDQNGLAAWRHSDIGAHDREIGMAFLKQARRFRKLSTGISLRRMSAWSLAKSSAAAAMIAWS